MIASYHKCAFLITALLSLGILLIRAQPYDDDDLRGFLDVMAHCPQRCFMDIDPYMMTVGQAVNVLHNHPWVNDVIEHFEMSTFSGDGHITWTWSGDQPDWINAAHNGRIWINRHRISLIVVETVIPFGAVHLAYGRPASGDIGVNQQQGLVHVARYPEQRFSTRTRLRCPVRLRHYWPSPVQMVIERLPAQRPFTPLGGLGNYC